MKLQLLLLVTVLHVMLGCSSASIQQYENETPKLVMEEYFNGNLEAHGVFQDRSGLVVKRFKVLMKCSWKDGVGTLEEDFFYSDGTKSRRVWTLTKVGEGRFKGTASDVIGEAYGQVAGNAFQWKYTLDLPVGDKSYHVQFDDWMYLMDDQIMLNKSKMSKFGIYLGEVTLAFVKPAKQNP